MSSCWLGVDGWVGGGDVGEGAGMVCGWVDGITDLARAGLVMLHVGELDHVQDVRADVEDQRLVCFLALRVRESDGAALMEGPRSLVCFGVGLGLVDPKEAEEFMHFGGSEPFHHLGGWVGV